MIFEEIAPLFARRELAPEDSVRQCVVNEAAREFAETIHRMTPRSADQTAAIRKVREARDLALDAIALNGKA